MLIFNYNTPPLLSEKSGEEIILNPIFNEDDPEKLAIDAAALLGRYFILKQAGWYLYYQQGQGSGREA